MDIFYFSKNKKKKKLKTSKKNEGWKKISILRIRFTKEILIHDFFFYIRSWFQNFYLPAKLFVKILNLIYHNIMIAVDIYDYQKPE